MPAAIMGQLITCCCTKRYSSSFPKITNINILETIGQLKVTAMEMMEDDTREQQGGEEQPPLTLLCSHQKCYWVLRENEACVWKKPSPTLCRCNAQNCVWCFIMKIAVLPATFLHQTSPTEDGGECGWSSLTSNIQRVWWWGHNLLAFVIHLPATSRFSLMHFHQHMNSYFLAVLCFSY